VTLISTLERGLLIGGILGDMNGPGNSDMHRVV